MKAIDIAKGVLELFQDDKAWLQGDFAGFYVEENGETYVDTFTTPDSDDATCYCLQGAVDKVAGYSFFSNDHGDDVIEEQPEIAKVAITMMTVLEEHHEAVDREDVKRVSDRFEPIVSWNDRTGRTVAEVREFVREVIVRLEKETAE
jgi:hypothetical protein